MTSVLLGERGSIRVPFDLPAELTNEDRQWVARQIELAEIARVAPPPGPTFLDPTVVLSGSALNSGWFAFSRAGSSPAGFRIISAGA